jgi:hypothetical protein
MTFKFQLGMRTNYPNTCKSQLCCPYARDWPWCLTADYRFRNGVKFRCGSCQQEYEDGRQALSSHQTCDRWSCSFLPNFKDIYDSEISICQLCDNGNYSYGLDSLLGLSAGAAHAVSVHNFRGCTQDIFLSASHFKAHMEEEHACTIRWDWVASDLANKYKRTFRSQSLLPIADFIWTE